MSVGSALIVVEENSKPKDPIDMLTSSEEINELISQGESYNEQLALSIGCTFNTTQFMPFQQRYYLCRTCNNSMNQHYALCLPCALFCHKGHDLVIGNAAKPIKIVCGKRISELRLWKWLVCLSEEQLTQQ